MYYETLTDLLNNDPAAYEYFYALPPEMQTATLSLGFTSPYAFTASTNGLRSVRTNSLCSVLFISFAVILRPSYAENDR